MVQGLVSAIKGWKLATEGMTLSQALLNIVMAANPIGIIITLIAALVGGLIVLWNTNEDFRNAVKKIFSDILATISKVVYDIVTFFTVTIPNALSKVGDWFKDIGTNIVKGVWSGITGMSQWFSDQVGEFFGGIVEGAKKLLGIQSPSKVFAGIGENMALGLGVGFQQEFADVQRHIQQAIPSISSSTTPNQPPSPSPFTSGSSIVIHQTIQSPKALSAFEIYRQTQQAGQMIQAIVLKG
jgi:phage-related protein